MASSRRRVPSAVHVRGVLRHLEGNLHVALRAKVVDLVRLHGLHDVLQAGGVGEVAVVQPQPHPLLVRVLVEMVDAVRVQAR